ncbi:hypothetical protein AMELA_G00246320 [Ameiurus melas]|uniref:Uncharacterized protein n=1 Tax=Ameiurus melas TaxID=219545 RepID=A0A7J5ZTG9_AMEME|nr:hypothetical protein AMELA_G00246320 [Ameiurus melas]
MSRLHEVAELEKCVRRLRETFHGQIPIDKATLLMRRYMNNYQLVAKEIILMKDRDLDDDDRWSLANDPTVKNVVEKLENEEREKEKRKDGQSGASNDPRGCKKSKANKGPQEDKDIQELGKRLHQLPLTEKNKRMFDRVQENQMPSVDRQFACGFCDKSWWRRVPVRKPVSRCRGCKRKYDPVPRENNWGIGEFICPHCSRAFKGFGRMDLGSPCYGCLFIVKPTCILPPRKNLLDPGLRRRHPHSCLAEDCFNRQERRVPGTECVHPVSRRKNGKPQVVHPSDLHISSGSTVNTCLSQGSLLEDLFDIIMEDIREEDESDSGSSTSS